METLKVVKKSNQHLSFHKFVFNHIFTSSTIKNVVSRYEKRWVYDKFMKERSSTIERQNKI